MLHLSNKYRFHISMWCEPKQFARQILFSSWSSQWHVCFYLLQQSRLWPCSGWSMCRERRRSEWKEVRYFYRNDIRKPLFTVLCTMWLTLMGILPDTHAPTHTIIVQTWEVINTRIYSLKQANGKSAELAKFGNLASFPLFIKKKYYILLNLGQQKT